MSRVVVRVVDSVWFMLLTVATLVTVVVWSVPMLFVSEGRLQPDPAFVERAQAAVPSAERVSVAVYGDSRGAFFGEGARLVPGWSPVFNLAREGCAFLGQDQIWRRYGTEAGVSERTTSKQGDGRVLSCDTRTYIDGSVHTDLAIVYAGTLLTVDNGVSPDSMHSPVEGALDPQAIGEWAGYLVDNLTATIERISADQIVILATPPSTSAWDGIGDPFWDDPDRILAVNAILNTVAARTGSVMLDGFPAWVAAQPASCEPDGSHFTIACATAAGRWIAEQIAALPPGQLGEREVPVPAPGTSPTSTTELELAPCPSTGSHGNRDTATTGTASNPTPADPGVGSIATTTFKGVAP